MWSKLLDVLLSAVVEEIRGIRGLVSSSSIKREY